MKIIETRFRVSSSPFWVAHGEVRAENVTMRRLSPGSTVVVVVNHRKNDYRVKVWAVPDGDNIFYVNGEKIELPLRGKYRHEGRVDKTAAVKIVQYIPKPKAPEKLNMCLDVDFEEANDPREALKGTVVSGEETGWGVIESIECTSAEQTRSQGIYITAPNAKYTDVGLTRINGVWCHSLPIGGTTLAGRYVVSATPEELAIIRSGSAQGQPLESTPPRTRDIIRRYNAVFDFPEYEVHEWTRAVQDLQDSTRYMLFSDGQIRYAQRRKDHYANEACKRSWWLADRYKKRDSKWASHSQGEWLDESGDRYGNQWRRGLKNYTDGCARYERQILNISKSLAGATEKREKALRVCERYETKYQHIWATD